MNIMDRPYRSGEAKESRLAKQKARVDRREERRRRAIYIAERRCIVCNKVNSKPIIFPHGKFPMCKAHQAKFLNMEAINAGV